MAKRVIGIILIVLSVLTIFPGIIFLVVFGLMGGIFGVVGNSGGLVVAEGSTVEYTVGEVYDVSDSETTIYYEVDGYTYVGELNVVNSAYSEGTEITVEYDSSNPANFAVPELMDVFGILGGVFGGAGIVIGLLTLIPGIAMLIIGIILVKKSKTVSVVKA